MVSPALLKNLQKHNKRMLLWLLIANDFKWSAEKVLDNLKNSIRSGDVVVFHDSQKAGEVALEVLPEFIEHCRGKGFGFGSLDDGAIRLGIFLPTFVLHSISV